MKPFNREKFLLFMLAGIFTWQATIFTFGVIGCFQKGGKESCPDLGDRYENTVNVMVATTLALLGAGAVAGVTQRKPSDDDPASPLPSPPQPLPRAQKEVQGKARVQESAQAQARARARESAQEKKGPPYTNQE